MVWESHQFQWALKTELLVACALPLCRHPVPLRLNPLALLSIREPIASRGNDGCKPSRTCFPISSKNTGCTPAEREYVERMCRERNALRNINVSAVFPVTIDIADFCINATLVKRINYGFVPAHTFVRGIPEQYNRPEGV